MKTLLCGVGAVILLLFGIGLAAQENKNANPARVGDIHEAAATGDLNKVRALLEADPTLLESKGDMGNTPLISACFAPPSFIPKVAVANFLIDKGANVNAKNDWGGTPLYVSINDFDLMQRLIAKGAEVNVKAFGSITPLHQAASSGNLKVAKLLIDHGADLNARSTDGTALHQIINRKSKSYGEMAKLLLESGTKLQEFSYGNTELHLAAMKGLADLVPLLIKHGADVNAVNEYGHTPLYYAAKHGYRRTADALISAGANKSAIVETNYGKAPQLAETLKEGEAYLWFLGGMAPGTGYAVKAKNHLLIFDPPGIDESPEAGLANGYLNPSELAGQKITVLITRMPHPQFGSSVSELAKRIPGADFVLSFKPTADSAGNSNLPPYRLATPNESFSVGDIKVHTIPAIHVPAMYRIFTGGEGLGYLVEADGVKVFHAGLHAARNEASQIEEYRKGIDFLKSFGPIDIAILPIKGHHLTIAYEPYLYLLDQLSPKAIYLIGDDFATEEHKKCVEVLRARNIPVAYPEGGIAVGERFHYLRDQAEKSQPSGKPSASSGDTGSQIQPETHTTVANPTITDVDGNVYKTVTIGNQVWMAENLRTTRYRNGDLIGTTSPATLDISSESTPKYQWAYAGDESNVATYGRLYTWYAATDSRNVCPAGWHVSTNDEWTTLTTFLGGEVAAQGKLKETGTTHWNSPNADATNESGFTALPGGNRWDNGRFLGIGDFTHWWTATEYDAKFAWRRVLGKDAPADNFRGSASKKIGWLVRCVRDASTLPSASTEAQENKNANPAGAEEIHTAATAGDLNKVRALLEAAPTLLESKDKDGDTPLHSACVGKPPSFTRQMAVASFLLDKGANVNARNNYGETPLHFASRGQGPDLNFDLMQLLIAKGADVNARLDRGFTSLHWVAISGDLKVAKLLIDHSADLNAYDKGGYGTVLQIAINFGRNEEMAKLLVESGAKLNQKFSFGNTELHLAAMKGYADLVPLLVKHGANVNAVNEYGHTPLYYAAKHGYRRTADALIAAGANKSAIVETNYGKAPQLAETLKEGEAYLWYLGGLIGRGYAVKTKKHLLLFDKTDIDESSEAGLANGHLNPNELAGQKITVLITKPVGVDGEPKLFELAKRMPGVDFVLSSKPSASGDIPPYRLAAPNTSFFVGDIQVHAIPARGRDFGGAEAGGLGYLVEVDGVKIFHAGFHSSGNEASQMERYRKEIDFLKPFGPIDVAILPVRGHVAAAYQPYLYLLDQLSPRAVYLMGSDMTEEYPKCAEVLRARDVPVKYPEGGRALGERFHYLRDQAEKSQPSGKPLASSGDSGSQIQHETHAAPAAVSFSETGQQLNRLAGRGVALADLNGDGCLDAFVVNVNTQDGEGHRVYFGNCHGQFTDSGQRLANPSNWEGTPAVGDVNGDGKPDVVTGNTVWINDGKGHFTALPELIEAPGVGAWGPVKLADLNGNGYLDLVAVADWGSIRVFLNDGKGHFRDTGQKMGSRVITSLALGDVNGNGTIDVVTAGWKIEGSDYAPSRVWLNDGKGNFKDAGPIDHGENHAHRIALGDVNGDGWLDVVMACTTPGQAGKVYLNDGKGHFHDSGQILGHRWSQSVALGDLSGDGFLDIFFANGDPETGGTPSEVWLNDGKGNFRDSGLRLGNAFSWDVALGDINGDGRLDAFVANIRLVDGSKNPPVFGGAPAEIWLNTTPQVALDYLGQPPPGNTPQVLARGIVSTDNLEHSAPAFSPDGNEVFWSLWRRPDKGEPQVIMTMRREGGTWSAPAVAPFSGKFVDGGPVFSADGRRIYFYSRRPTPAGKTSDDIWFVEKQDNGWGEPHCLGFVARFPEMKAVYQPSITRNGTLYFISRPKITPYDNTLQGSPNAFLIYRAELINGKYPKPELLPQSINAPDAYVNWTPFIAPDESYLLFSSHRHNRDGDLYIARRNPDGTWTQPEILPESINTPEQERFPAVSPDGKYLFFTRPTPGHSHDVYWVSTAAIPALRSMTNLPKENSK